MRRRTNLVCSDNSPATCETCEPGGIREFTYSNLTVLLGNSTLFVLDSASYSLRQTLSLHEECVPQALRPSVDDPGKFYVRCRSINNPAYQQVIIDPETGEFDMAFFLITGYDLPPSERNGVFVTIRTDSGLEDVFMWIDYGEFYLRSLKTEDEVYFNLYDEVQCDQWDDIHPFPPPSQPNKLRLILDCTHTTTSTVKRYLLDVDLYTSQVDSIALDTSGTTFGSPDGEYILFVSNSSIEMHLTSVIEGYAHKEFNGRIQETKFLDSQDKLYLAVIIQGESYKVVDVPAFFSSGGQDGVSVLPVMPHCTDTTCLPHGLIEPGSSYYITASKNGNVYQVAVFDLADSTQLATFGDILDQPAALYFVASSTPTPSSSSTPTTDATPTVSQPTSGPTVTRNHSLTSTSVEKTSVSNSATPTGLPNTENKHDANVAVIAIVSIAGVLLFSIIFTAVCLCIICKCKHPLDRKRQERSLGGDSTPSQVKGRDTGIMCLPNNTLKLVTCQRSCNTSVTVVVDPELTSSAYSSKPSSMNSSRASTPQSSQGDLQNTSGMQHLYPSPQLSQRDLQNTSGMQHLYPSPQLSQHDLQNTSGMQHLYPSPQLSQRDLHYKTTALVSGQIPTPV